MINMKQTHDEDIQSMDFQKNALHQIEQPNLPVIFI